MKLKVGMFAVSGAAAFFEGIVNWLTGNDAGNLFASEDGQKFREVNTDIFGTSNVNDVFYGPDLSSPGNETFLAAGNNGKLAKSSDGLTWSTINTGDINNLTTIGYGGAPFAPGGTVWTTVTSNFGTKRVNSLAYGNGLWVAAGASWGGDPGFIRISTNGSTWTTVTSNFGNSGINTLGYGNGIWIVAGYNGQMRRSTNGSTWTTVTSNFATGNAGQRNIYAVAYGNGLWVAVGYLGQIRTSTNGITWTTVNSNFGNSAIRGIAYGNGVWVAGGPLGKLRRSTNGSTWTTVDNAIVSGNNTYNGISYANGAFFGCASLGRIAKSTDGITWTTATTAFESNFSYNKGIAYGGERYISFGGYGEGVSEMRISTDSVNWTVVTSNIPAYVDDAEFANNLWVACGIQGAIRTSSPEGQNFISYFVGVE